MKTDYSFKLVTVIVLAGVFVAFFSPAPSPGGSATTSAAEVSTAAITGE